MNRRNAFWLRAGWDGTMLLVLVAALAAGCQSNQPNATGICQSDKPPQVCAEFAQAAAARLNVFAPPDQHSDWSSALAILQRSAHIEIIETSPATPRAVVLTNRAGLEQILELGLQATVDHFHPVLSTPVSDGPEKNRD